MEYIKLSHDLLEKIASSVMPLVLIESPLAAASAAKLVLNKKYARLAMRDCISRGEAPYASHLLYVQEGLLDDTIPDERAVGIHAGFLWGDNAAKTVVYTDLGISPGMQKGIERAQSAGRQVEYRLLGFIPEVTPKEIQLELLRREVELEIHQEIKEAANMPKICHTKIKNG